MHLSMRIKTGSREEQPGFQRALDAQGAHVTVTV